MPVNSQTSLLQFSITTLGQALSFPIYFINSSDLLVIGLNPTTSIATTLTLGVDYTVSGAGNPGGGTVTLEATGLHYATGDTVTVERNPPLTQPTNYTDGTAYPAAVDNATVDWLVMQIQAQRDRIDRSLRLPLSGVGVNEISLVSRKNTFVGFDAVGALYLYPSNTVASGVITQTPTGFIFRQDGANINRLNDRVFVAGAAVADGLFPQSTNDWLSTYFNANGYTSYTLGGDLTVLTGTNYQDAQALVAGSRTLNFTSAGTSALAVSAYAINNNLTHATQAWAYYGEAHKVNATAGAVYGMELDTKTLVASIAPTPYLQGDVIGIQIASGCGLSTGPTQFDASAAIQIQANPKKFKAGIVFGNTALAGNDGTTGSAPAILLPNGDRIDWYSPNGALGADINCTVTTTTLGSRLLFSNAGMSVLDYQNNGVLTVASSATAISNGLTISGGISASSAITLAAGGGDTNINFNVTPKGTGALAVGGANVLRLAHTSAPASPVNGDIWTTTAGIFVRVNGSTVGPLS